LIWRTIGFGKVKLDLSSCKDISKGTILYESHVLDQKSSFYKLCLLLTGCLQDQAKYDASCFNSSFSSKLLSENDALV
jgi:hypothetical protein